MILCILNFGMLLKLIGPVAHSGRLRVNVAVVTSVLHVCVAIPCLWSCSEVVISLKAWVYVSLNGSGLKLDLIRRKSTRWWVALNGLRVINGFIESLVSAIVETRGLVGRVVVLATLGNVMIMSALSSFSIGRDLV